MQQTFTSNWPKNLWLAVDQRGVHLLEARSRNVLTTYEYEGLIDLTPSINHMLIITGTDKKQSKIIVNTNQVGRRDWWFIRDVFILCFQAFQMSNLIREYMEKIVETQERHQIGMVNGSEGTVPIHLQ